MFPSHSDSARVKFHAIISVNWPHIHCHQVNKILIPNLKAIDMFLSTIGNARYQYHAINRDGGNGRTFCQFLYAAVV